MSPGLRYAAVGACVLLVLAGCGPNATAPRARVPSAIDAAPPRALLAEWHRSLVGGQKDRYLACFAGSQDDLVLVLAMFEAVQAGYAFHDAVVATYGPEAWKLFESGEGARVDLFPRDAAWPRRITVVRTGAAACGYLPRGRVPLHLAESGGAWRLQAASLVPPGYEARQVADYLFRYAAALRKLVPEIGQRRLSAEKATEADYFRDLAPAERPKAAAAVEALLAQ